MNIIEKYALNCGVKIEKPKIYQKYFPIPMEKYIYFDPNVNLNEKNYKYWEEVISSLSEELQKHNIHILYVNYKNIKPIDINQRVINLARYSLNKNQHAYLINNCELYLGGPSFGMNVASLFNKKIVSICGNSNFQNEYPYWSSKEMIRIILPDTKSKPFYNHEDQEERINTIFPETIVRNTLELLGIKLSKNFSTVYIGENFNSKTLELIPEDLSVCSNVNINNPVIRMDYYFNETVLSKILERYQSSIIFTKKPINSSLIEKYRNNISTVIYSIDENHDPKFIKDLRSIGIPFNLMTNLNLSDFNDIKLDYMDLGLIKEIPIGTKPINLPKTKIFYKTNRTIIGKLGKFMTKFDWENNRLSTQPVIPDNNKFWEEDASNLFLYTIDNNL